MKTTALLLAAALSVSQLYAQTSKVKIDAWLTTADRSNLLQPQLDSIFFNYSGRASGTPIVIDDRQQFQEMDGFGFAITGGTAEHLMKMSAQARKQLLQELFSAKGSGISYLRLSIGASDLNSFVFSYDDLKDGETDMELKKFSLSQDMKDVVPIMKEILAINPRIKILGSPWSAPAWMKTNNNVRSGSLKKECYPVYAHYFVKYIESMKKEGIIIDAITVQNEPLNSKNTPSMQWLWNEENEFIKKHLGPAFAKANIKTKIILFDHNLDRPDYPLAILADPETAKYVDGSGFHHYAGDISAMSIVHTARPDKNLYFTEQMVIERPDASNIAIASQVKRLIVGASRNWSRNVILWNLAADQNNDPHTDNGGCTMCQGAITIMGDQVKRNIAFYTIAHASAFVPAGSYRIASTNTGEQAVSVTEDEERPGIKRIAVNNAAVLPNVAFKTPDGRIVLIVVNDSWGNGSCTIQYNGATANVRLPAGAVGTYVFKAW